MFGRKKKTVFLHDKDFTCGYCNTWGTNSLNALFEHREKCGEGKRISPRMEGYIRLMKIYHIAIVMCILFFVWMHYWLKWTSNIDAFTLGELLPLGMVVYPLTLTVFSLLYYFISKNPNDDFVDRP